MTYRYAEIRCSHGFLADARICPECPQERAKSERRPGPSLYARERAKAVYDYVLLHPGCDYRDLMAATGLNQRETKKRIDTLIDAGQVEVIPPRGRIRKLRATQGAQ